MLGVRLIEQIIQFACGIIHPLFVVVQRHNLHGGRQAIDFALVTQRGLRFWNVTLPKISGHLVA